MPVPGPRRGARGHGGARRSGRRRRIEPSFPASHRNFRTLEVILREIPPALRHARITHDRGGALAIPRDWRPRVGLDRERGRAWIGGYVGEGVAASNLAGRTLAELIAGETTERTELPFIAPPARDWEVEPLRYFAVRGVLGLIGAADPASEPGKGPRWRQRLVRAIAQR